MHQTVKKTQIIIIFVYCLIFKQRVRYYYKLKNTLNVLQIKI